MNEKEQVLKTLDDLNIPYEYHEHPPIPTIEAAMEYWGKMESTHCKNLFFRNHKGNKHYLVILECHQNLSIKDLEQRLKQGKISFASDKRLSKFLGLKAGSVSPFGLINDMENHVHLFIDENLKKVEKISFHPNDNTATLIISIHDFYKFLKWSGNSFEFIQLYN
jgi:Ala-tRNA(Pro) deacylase